MKSDIRYLNIDEIPAAVDQAANELAEERLAALRANVEAANNRKLKMFASDAAAYIDSEAGSDGLEEHVKEAVNFPDPAEVELGFEAMAECRLAATEAVLKRYLEEYAIAEKYTWVMPQMRSHFGTWVPVLGEDGKYCGLATAKKNCVDNDFNKGLWYLSMRPRSGLVGGVGVRLYQVPEYNSLVPLILSAFKVYKNIPYSDWSRKNLNFVVDKDLCEGMLSEVPTLSNGEWLQIRNSCLVYQTGNNKGKMRDPKTTPMLYGVKSTSVGNVAKYALIMKSQIWCAHPSNRSPYMVLDPENWDTMPEPIVSGDVLSKSKPKIFSRNSTFTADVPW